MTGSLLQFAVALAGAIGVFLLGKLLVAGGHRSVEPVLAWVRPALIRVDQFLTRSLARWIGLDETRGWRRWARLLGCMVSAGFIGAVAPWPLGVAALCLGLLAVLAVFRRWAWDEEDRSLGLPAEDRRFPSGEDLGDEALAALAAVVMLSSLLVWRLTGAQAFEGPSTQAAPGYLLHILSETLAALPIVGNIDLLGYEDPSGVRVVQPGGGPIAFALRMAIDLLVIGGLLKAVDIARRIARGQDLRREEEALASREPTRVLASITNLRRLALGGDANAMQLLSTGAAHAQAGQSPRARLCAIHALRAAAAQQPAWAANVLLDNRLACAALLEEPATAEAGLLGATHVEYAENALAQMRGSQSAVAAKLLGSAISSLGQALLSTGHAPGPDAFLLDPPGQTSALLRTGLVLRIAKLKISLAEYSHMDSRGDILKEALSHTYTVLNHMPVDAPGEMRFRAHLWHAEILARLGEMDTGYEGSVMLSDALDAFAQAETLMDGRDALQRAGAWTGHGVAHEILGHRTQGPPALAHFTEAARLFDTTAELMVEVQAPPAERAASFLNLGNACGAAACAVVEEVEATVWLERATQAFATALHTVGAGHWPGLTVQALDGLASSHEHRFQLTGDPTSSTAAIGARMGILDHFDADQSPVEWALAAMALSRAELATLHFATSSAMGHAALDRLRQARERLMRAEGSDVADAMQKCDALMQAFQARG